MNTSSSAINLGFSRSNAAGSSYLAIDGLVKYCITAPLLELPVDFKEWYRPTGSNDATNAAKLSIAC